MLRLLLILIFVLANLHANVTLTKKEKEWLKNNPIIRIGIDPNFAPVEYIDEDGEFRGVTADYLKEMSKTLDVEFEIVKNRTWNEIINMVKAKSIDVLSCIVETPERSKYLDYTSVYLSVPMVIVTNKETGYINDIKELDGKAVAVIDGYTPNELLEKNHKKIYLVKTKDLEKALELVSTGKTFAHVGNLSRATYILKEKGFRNLTISGITHYKYHFSMGVTKGNYLLQSIIQKAFDAIPEKVKNDIYNKWFPVNFRQDKDYTLAWQILAGTFLITLAFSFWVFRLSRHLKRRKIDKEALIEDKLWLNSSLESFDLAAWEWDFQTGQIKGNPEFARILAIGEKETQMPFKCFKNFIDEEDLKTLLIDLEKHFSKEVKKSKTRIKIKTKKGEEKYIDFVAKILKYDIFNHPKKIVGIIKEVKRD